MKDLKITKIERAGDGRDENGMLRLVYAEVYAPSRPDSGGDFIRADEIRKMAHAFMRKLSVSKVDVMHDNKSVEGVQVVESFIARDDDELFIPGSWVVGVHVPDDATWARIEKGELNGFSLEALAWTEKGEVEVEIPPVIRGATSRVSDHEHQFFVSYDDKGVFQGGTTDSQDGHVHLIKGGTVTEEAAGHTHRFSSVDNLLIY